MITPLWFSNALDWIAQVAVLVLGAGLLPYIFKIKQPQVLLTYWRILIGACLLLPLVQPWQRQFYLQVESTTITLSNGEIAQLILNSRAHQLSYWQAHRPELIAQTFAVIVLAGIAARFTIFALGLLKLRQFRNASSPVSNHAESSVLLDEMRIRVNTVGEFRLSSDVDSPVTFGLSAPVILLPERFPTLDPQYQSAIACHELLHVRRGDWAHHLTEEIVRAALWFHPAIAWLIARIRLSREQVVDLEVVKLTDARKPYLEALLEFTNSRALATAIPAPPFLVERQLAERVALMLKEVRMSRTRLIASLTAIAACLAIVATLAVWAFPLKAAPRAAQNPPQGGIIDGVVGGVASGIVNGVVGGIVGGVSGGVSDGISTSGPAQGVRGGVIGGVTSGVPGGVVSGVPGSTTLRESPGQPAPKIVVTDIKFVGEVHDADAVRARVIKYSQAKNWNATDPDWLDELAEVGVRGDFQDHGYFEVNVDGVKSQILDSTPTQQRVVASFNVKEGDQFRTGEFTFVGFDSARGPVIPAAQLREQFHLQPGEILNVEELRHGIERIFQLYGARGYLDFTARPNFTVDHQGRTVAMALTLTEGIQYHVASFTVRGLDTDAAARLEIKIQPGALYDNSLVHELFERGKAASGSTVSWVDGIHVTRHAESRTLDIVLDFLPKSQQPPPPAIPPQAKTESVPPGSDAHASDGRMHQVPPTKTPATNANDSRIIGKFQLIPPATASSQKFQVIPPVVVSSPPALIVHPGAPPITSNRGIFQTVAPAYPANSHNSNSQSATGQVYRAGQNGVSTPLCEYCPKPEYSEEARSENFSGTVYLQVVVLKDGRAGEIKVVKTLGKGLDEQAISVVRDKWTFKPAVDANGDPVDVTVPIEIAFQLYPPPSSPPAAGAQNPPPPVPPPAKTANPVQTPPPPPAKPGDGLQTKIFTAPVSGSGESTPFYIGRVKTETLYAPQPEFPQRARQMKIYSGTVTLDIIVDTEGNVISVTADKSSSPIFVQPAIETVRKWKIKGTHDGVPVTFELPVEITFNSM